MRDANPTKIRALIVDDEPLARRRIRSLLAHDSGVDVIGECSDGYNAVSSISELTPDLVFLDIQMPRMDGFEVIKTIGPERMPTVIFVTAYDQYALKAFEVNALDYLLKPYDRRRFQKTLERAKASISGLQSGNVNNQLLSLLGNLRREREIPDRFIIKSGGRVVFLKVEEIDWMCAVGNYVRLQVGRDSHLMRETMTGMEAKLDPSSFMRIHRSTIVNLDRVKEVQPWAKGEYVVIMRDGARLIMSRRYRERLNELLNKPI
ncbi:MAG TPA: response regulator [Pyrinomonadaceae bacterium]